MKVYSPLYDLESVVENGKFHIFGIVFVDEQLYLKHIEELRQALAKDIRDRDVLRKIVSPKVEQFTQLIENSRCRVCGRALIDVLSFFTISFELHELIPEDVKKKEIKLVEPKGLRQIPVPRKRR